LLDHESLVRQVRNNTLDDHECGETEDRVPSVGHHDVIPTWQSFILGSIEKELYETLEQRRAKVVDILSSADAVRFSGPKKTLRNRCGWAVQN
jgi:leucyl aminopeptidase (aminopeptidase T)